MCSTLDNCTLDQDCVLSDWTDWNGCSCSCYGERHRHVEKLPVNGGKRCNEESLKEVAPCNPAMDEERPGGCRAQGPENCTFSQWEAWSTCSKPCGVADRTRMRLIDRPLTHNGFPCEGELAEIDSCNEFFCPENHCIDCLWGAWSENECGRKCDPGGAKETMNCTGSCDEEDAVFQRPLLLIQYYCRWSEWNDLGKCTATCGTSVRIVQRRLEITDVPGDADDWNETLGGNYMFAGSKSMVCSGEQSKTVECDTVPCDEGCFPRPCLFGAWNEWSEPSCTQLCNRDRVIAQRSSCGGEPCRGAQTETKVCERPPCVEVVDCALSERYQEVVGFVDAVFSQRPKMEIEPCEHWKEYVALRDCELTEWGSWTACTALCNGGLKHRLVGRASLLPEVPFFQ
eukprot:g10594.t1